MSGPSSCRSFACESTGDEVEYVERPVEDLYTVNFEHVGKLSINGENVKLEVIDVDDN